MKGRERVLTALELACFAALSLGAGLGGFALGNEVLGVAVGLVVAGGSGIYLVNAYAVALPAEDDDA